MRKGLLAALLFCLCVGMAGAGEKVTISLITKAMDSE